MLKAPHEPADAPRIALRTHPMLRRPLQAYRKTGKVLAREEGFTLVESLCVILLLGILLGPVIAAMISTSSAEARQANIFTAQENARTALARMREDIHCAHSVGVPVANASGGVTIILNETNATGTAECPGLLAPNSSSVQWCTIPVTGFSNRYRLFREDDPNINCDGSVSTFEVDYLTETALWSTPACTGGEYPTVSVSLPMQIAAATMTGGYYKLGDQIALRNATSCP